MNHKKELLRSLWVCMDPSGTPRLHDDTQQKAAGRSGARIGGGAVGVCILN